MRSAPLCIAVWFLTLLNGVTQQPGSVDTTFDISAFLSAPPEQEIRVENVFPLQSGKVLVASRVAFVGTRPLQRLMPSGAVDPSFQCPLTAAGVMVEEPNGRIVVHDFSTLGLRRIETDGTIDPSFKVNLTRDTTFPQSATVHSVVRQPDGRYLISGSFTAVDGVERRGIARLCSDGKVDRTFVPSPEVRIANSNSQVLLQPDGMILYLAGSGNQLFRMSPTGKLDSTYKVVTANGDIRHMLCQPDGRLVVVGSFGYISSLSSPGFKLAPRVARLNIDGSLDESFLSSLGGANGNVRSVASQPDGKILIAGDFTSYNGQATRDVARLNRDGSFDPTFVVGPRPPESTALLTNAFCLNDGKVLLWGTFTSIDEYPLRYVARVFGGEPPASEQGVAQMSWFELNVNETAGIVKVPVIRTGGNTGALTVSYATADSTAHAGVDYSTTSGELAFADGETVKEIAVPIIYNDQIGGQRAFKLTLMGATGSPASCLVTIHDNDRPSIMSVGLATRTLREDAPSVDILITRAESDRAEQSVIVQTASVTAEAGVDYTSVSQRVMFEEGVFEAWISVPLHPDQLVEGNEQLTVTLGSPSAQAQLSDQITTTVTLVDANDIGSIDLSFRPMLGKFAHSVSDILVQPDRKILIAGWILLPDATQGIARLNADGSMDSSFHSPETLNFSVARMALQKDGKILIGGGFSQIGDVTRRSIARLNADGSVDPTFDAGSLFENKQVNALALQSDGRILVSAGSGPNLFVRLNPDGSNDPSFISTVYQPHKLLVLPDDRVLVASYYQSLTRLLPDGATDEQFASDLPRVNSMSLDPRGRILIGYDTRVTDGQITGGVARLLPDGQVDSTFQSHFDDNSFVRELLPLGDGKIILIGKFSSYAGVERTDMMRILEDGSPDAEFYVFSDSAEESSSIGYYVLRLHPSGKVLVGGNRTRLDGVEQAGIGLLLSEPQPGVIRFAQQQIRSEEGEAAGVELTLERVAGLTGTVSVHYATEDGTAVAGNDYVSTSGELEFPEGVDSMTIIVPLLDDGEYEHTEAFGLHLTAMSGGATVDDSGGAAVVVIEDHDPGDMNLLVGKYSGRLLGNSALAATAGRVDISLGKQGKFTGTLTLGGRRHAFRGSFDSAGVASIDLGTPGLLEVKLNLQLDLVPGNGLIRAVAIVGGESIDLDLYRNLYTARANPAPQAGSYTLVLEPDPVVETAPLGSGFAFVRVLANGTLRVSGRLADGTAVSLGGHLSPFGELPVFAPLYSRKGCVVGDLNFISTPLRDCEGALSWIRPAKSGRSPNPGFSQSLEVSGSIFEPAPRTRVVPFSLALITITPNTGPAIERHITISSSNRISVTVQGAELLKLQLSPRTGFLSGTFVDQAGVKRAIRGALLLDENRAAGFSTGAGQFGSFTLESE
jgi:uncharacterized delta-60 repeat protein